MKFKTTLFPVILPVFLASSLLGQERPLQEETSFPVEGRGTVEFGGGGFFGDVYGRPDLPFKPDLRSEEHTSELQSH